MASYGAVLPDGDEPEIPMVAAMEGVADSETSNVRRSPWRVLAFSTAATLALGAAVVATRENQGVLAGAGSFMAASRGQGHSSHHHNRDSPTAAPTTPSISTSMQLPLRRQVHGAAG